MEVFSEGMAGILPWHQSFAMDLQRGYNLPYRRIDNLLEVS